MWKVGVWKLEIAHWPYWFWDERAVLYDADDRSNDGKAKNASSDLKRVDIQNRITAATLLERRKKAY